MVNSRKDEQESVSEGQVPSHREWKPAIESAPEDGAAPLSMEIEDYRDYLLYIARRGLDGLLRPKVGASDLVQETLLEAARDRSEFEGKTHEELREWLRKILHHTLLNAARHYKTTQQRNVRREVSLDAAGSAAADAVANLADSGPAPDAQAIATESHVALLMQIARLPENQRRAIVLRSFERLKFEEIGVELGISGDAARKLWARAVEKLARTMDPH